MIERMKPFFCQKVLPLVYDNSLSYYEVLCKLREKLDEVITVVNELVERVTILEELVQELDERVTACEEAIDGLEMRVEELETVVADLGERIINIEIQLDDLHDRMANCEGNIDDLIIRMNTADEDILRLSGKSPLYIVYDDVDVPDPGEFVEEIEFERRPVYLRLITESSGVVGYKDYPMFYYRRATTGTHTIEMKFFDGDGLLASDIADDKFVGESAIGLSVSDNYEPYWSGESLCVPDISSKNGKLLAVKSDGTGVEWIDAPDGLPDITGNNSKVLAVNAAGTAVEWATVVGGNLPAVGAGDAGKVLVVNEQGDGVEWGVASGSGLPTITAGDAGKFLVVNQSEDGAEWVDGPTELYGTGNITFRYSDYSNADLDIISDIVTDGIWTSEELAKYDFDLDGKITLADRTILSGMLTNSQDRVISASVDVNADDVEQPITLSNNAGVVLGSYVKQNEIYSPSGTFERVGVGNTVITEDSIGTRSNGGEIMTQDSENGIKFYDDGGNLTGVYPPNAKRFLQDNDIGVNNMEGCGYDAYNESGSDTFSLSSDHVYLCTIVQRNGDNPANDGVWLVYSNSNGSHVSTIKSSAGATLTVNNLSMTITRSFQYSKFTFTRLA